MVRSRLEIAAGAVYEKLTVSFELPVRSRKGGGTERWFRCVCECGAEVDVLLGRLRSGKTKSCGCLRSVASFSGHTDESIGKLREIASKREDYHGMEDSPEWSVWKGIKKRCYNVRARGYENYGGRGIVMCSGWKSSFKSFFVDMGARPSLDHSIDRRDGDKNYSCGHCEECVEKGWVANCRWATRAEQRRNAKNVRMLTFQGETMCMADWAKRKGMSKSALSARLDKMSVEEALRDPVRQWSGDRK